MKCTQKNWLKLAMKIKLLLNWIKIKLRIHLKCLLLICLTMLPIRLLATRLKLPIALFCQYHKFSTILSINRRLTAIQWLNLNGLTNILTFTLLHPVLNWTRKKWAIIEIILSKPCTSITHGKLLVN